MSDKKREGLQKKGERIKVERKIYLEKNIKLCKQKIRANVMQTFGDD